MIGRFRLPQEVPKPDRGAPENPQSSPSLQDPQDVLGVTIFQENQQKSKENKTKLVENTENKKNKTKPSKTSSYTPALLVSMDVKPKTRHKKYTSEQQEIISKPSAMGPCQ